MAGNIRMTFLLWISLLASVTDTVTSETADCQSGEFRSSEVGNTGCKKCPKGTYQDKKSQLTCINCSGSGNTTRFTGAKSKEQCIPDCPDGQEYSIESGGKCFKCPIGQIRAKAIHDWCIFCPEGESTLAAGSKTCVKDPAPVIPSRVAYLYSFRVLISFEVIQCDNGRVIHDTILSVIRSRFLRITIKFRGFCRDDTCSNAKLVMHSRCPGRRKRATILNALAIISDLPEKLTDPSTGVSRDGRSLLAEAVENLNTEVSDLAAAGITFETMGDIEGSQSCPEGSRNDTTINVCVGCPKGSKMVGESCQNCLIGEYQDEIGQTTCKKCPDSRPITDTGADSLDLCLSDCPDGQEFSIKSGGGCFKCPIGQIRNNAIHDWCVFCPEGKSTLAAGSSTCIKDPTPVDPSRVAYLYSFQTVITFEVIECENSRLVHDTIQSAMRSRFLRITITFRGFCRDETCSNANFKWKRQCRQRRKRANTLNILAVVSGLPERLTDQSNGVSRDGGSLLAEALKNLNTEVPDLAAAGITFETMGDIVEGQSCPEGSRNDTTTNTCAGCPKGSKLVGESCQNCSIGEYQDEIGQTTCKKCPGSRPTTDTGADSLDLCLSMCELETDYCKNGGQCRNKTDYGEKECICTDAYSGETCTVRRAVDSNLPWIITCVCVGVFVLLLAVLAIRCLCRRKRYSHETDEKKHSVATNHVESSAGHPNYMVSPFVAHDTSPSQGYIDYRRTDFPNKANDIYPFHNIRYVSD